MSDDLTEKIPGTAEPAQSNSEKVDVLISAIQSLSADFQEVKVRLDALERTVSQRSFDTQPIWERALAEISATRAEVSELRAEVSEFRAEVSELRAEVSEVRAELSEVRAELAETKAELRAEMQDGFRTLGSKMEVLNEDLLTLRGNQRLLDRRVENLESKTSNPQNK
jgi:chromosome segregation ATPase